MTANLTIDRDGIVVAWDEGAVLLLGYPQSHAVGRSMEFFIPEEHRADRWAGFQRAMANEALPFDPAEILPVEMVHRNGERLPVHVTVLAQRDRTGRITSLMMTAKAADPR